MLSEPITVREATAADIPFLRAMIWEAILASPAQLAHYGLETMRQLEDSYWTNWAKSKSPDPSFVAVDASGRKLAAITVKPNDTNDPVQGWRIGIGVEDSARGHGVGKLLMERAIDFARTYKAHYVTLFVDPTNTPAIRLYRRVGFIETGERDGLIEMRIQCAIVHHEGAYYMDANTKKRALRSFTYGLFAISCADLGEVNIFTANWITQASFEPPLLALSVENDSKSLPMIQRSRKFTVNVLRSGQRELAGKLGKSAIQHPDKLAGIEYTLGANGCPLLPDALAWVACEVRHSVEAGDSTIMIAEVVDAGFSGEGQPLTMNEAGFRHAG